MDFEQYCTVFYDQMTLYAAIRKSQKELRSVKLTDVAHDEKLDYSEGRRCIQVKFLRIQN